MISLDPKVYELISLAMRYFFIIMGIMIVLRAFSWLRKDRQATHRRLRQLPDAGTIGILTVEQGCRELPEGSIIPVPHEGVMGFLRSCDVVVPVEDVATMHLDFSFRNGTGLYIFPRRGCDVIVDGELLQNRRDGLRHPMVHGSTLSIGQAVLRLGVFAGLNVPEAPFTFYISDARMDAPAEEALQQPYQGDPREAYPPYPPANQPLGFWQGGDSHAP